MKGLEKEKKTQNEDSDHQGHVGLPPDDGVKTR